MTKRPSIALLVVVSVRRDLIPDATSDNLLNVSLSAPGILCVTGDSAANPSDALLELVFTPPNLRTRMACLEAGQGSRAGCL